MDKENEIIAEYMGGTLYSDDIWKADSSRCSVAHMLDNAHNDELKFNSNWEWLMPVVEKLELEGYEFCIFTDYVDVTFGSDEIFIAKFTGENKFKAVLNACVKIISEK
jgi:hypothetical protein